jgi:drug/metabolite transporter (DMT)-like permease
MLGKRGESAMNKTARWSAIGLILLGATCYGLLSPIIKLAYQAGFNQGEISVSQMTMGMLITWLLVLVRPKSWSNPFKGPWIRLSIIGIFGLAFTTILFNSALAVLDASLTIVLLFQFTWITIVLDSIVHKRWPSLYQMIAVLIVMIGTLFAVNIFVADWSQISILGIVLGLGSAFTYSLFLFLTGLIDSKMDSLMKSAIMLTAALLPIYLIYPPHYLYTEGMGSLILWGMVLGTLGQVGPTLFFTIGIPRVGSSVAALLGSLELPVGLLGALFIVGESVLTVQWLGMLLILVGIFVSELKFRR